MKFNSIKENFNGFLISTAILSFSILVIHKAKFKTPPFYYDVLVTKLILSPFFLFVLMCGMLFLIGDKNGN